MHGVANRLGALVVAWVLGLPVAAQAQSTLAKLVGTWEEVRSGSPVPHKDRPGYRFEPESRIYRTLTFRPDTTWLMSDVWVSRGDTVACTMIQRAGGWTGDTLLPPEDSPDLLFRTVASVQGQGLTVKKLYHDSASVPFREIPGHGEAGAYKRIDPSQRRFAQVIATGFGPGRPIPPRPNTPTGTLADVVGMWEWDSGSYTGAPDNLVRSLYFFRPDSTSLSISVRTWNEKRDTLACAWGQGEDWKNWKREPGDTLLKNAGYGKEGGARVVLRNQQLSFFFYPHGYSSYAQLEEERFKPINWPKRP